MQTEARKEGISFYFFDIDDNLLFLPTKIHLWNAESQAERSISSGEVAHVHTELGRTTAWQAWSIGPNTFRDFRDDPNVAPDAQPFIRDLTAAMDGESSWRGPAWPLLEHAALNDRPVAFITARGHSPDTITRGLSVLVNRGHLRSMPNVLGIYTVTNPTVREQLGVNDPLMTVPSVKKLAIRHAVEVALEKYGVSPKHRFGMSDDDPNNVVLAISAMRDCKVKHPDKRFFVINTHHNDYVKLEIFPMRQPVTTGDRDERVLSDVDPPEPRVSSS